MPPVHLTQSARVKLPEQLFSIIFSVLLVLLVAFAWHYREQIASTLVPLDWKGYVEKSDKLKDSHPQEAISCLQTALEKAKKTNVDTSELANIYFKLGILYIETNERQSGKEYVNRAIGLVEKTKEYDKVAEFCQNASWAEHGQYWKDHSQLPSIDYEKKAISAAVKTWGGSASEIYLWTLAQLYMDLGNLPEAQKCISSASKMLADKHKDLTSYDYICLCRLYALQHKWKESLNAFSNARIVPEQVASKVNFKPLDDTFQKTLEDANPEGSKYDFAIAKKLLQEKDFDKLDSMADELRKKPLVLPDGHWQIDKFYDALLYLDDSYSDERWQKYINNLTEWTNKMPSSVTAKIALANAYVHYASKAVGGDSPENANQAALDLAGQRLEKACEELNKAHELPIKCPHFYDVMANIALEQKWPRTAHEKMVLECQAAFPNYLPIYMSKAYYLQPHWNGISGECHHLIMSLVKEAGSEEKGDIVYAQMLWYLDNLKIFDNIFADNSVFDWPKAKDGLLALIKRYPHDALIRKELISLALQADDLDTVKHAFDTPL